jgi:hypothetical protein
MTETNGWEIMDVYSRKEALSDGVQVEANPKTRKEAGINFPVFFTQKVYEKYVKVPKGFETVQQEDGRLWDVFTMFRHYARQSDSNIMEIQVIFFMPDVGDWEPNEKRARGMSREYRIVTLIAEIGPMDFDNPAPAITISIPGED